MRKLIEKTLPEAAAASCSVQQLTVVILAVVDPEVISEAFAAFHMGEVLLLLVASTTPNLIN